MKLHCSGCEKEFVPGPFNTQIIGPDVQVNCPFCDYQFNGKLTSFVRDQLNNGRPQSAANAREMIATAKYMELNSSEYYKKRGLRHGKKKVRNVRD